MRLISAPLLAVAVVSAGATPYCLLVLSLQSCLAAFVKPAKLLEDVLVLTFLAQASAIPLSHGVAAYLLPAPLFKLSTMLLQVLSRLSLFLLDEVFDFLLFLLS